MEEAPPRREELLKGCRTGGAPAQRAWKGPETGALFDRGRKAEGGSGAGVQLPPPPSLDLVAQNILEACTHLFAHARGCSKEAACGGDVLSAQQKAGVPVKRSGVVGTTGLRP